MRGMPRQERVERRAEMHPPEGHRRRDAQRAGERAAALGQVGGRLLDIARDAGRPLEECRAVLGEGQLTRRAVHEGRAQAPLELGQPFAHDRFRQAQAPRGLADRARLRDRHEGGDAVELHHRSANRKASSDFSSLNRTTGKDHSLAAQQREPDDGTLDQARLRSSPAPAPASAGRRALLFAAEGAKLVVGARRAAELEQLVAEIEAQGGEAVALAGDVRSEDYAKALVALAVERFGRLDIAFNNAGTLGESGPSTGVSEAGWTMRSPST